MANSYQYIYNANTTKWEKVAGSPTMETGTQIAALALILTSVDDGYAVRCSSSGSGYVIGYTYTWNGATLAFETDQLYTDGYANVIIGSTTGAARIREEDALAGTAVTFTWPSPGVKSVLLQAECEALAVAGTKIDTVAVCIDPPSTAVRDAWLTAGDSISADSQRILVKCNGPDLELVFSSPITKLGAIRDIGANNIRFVAIGTEVS